MTSTSEIKRELISIISDYKETMSKDLEQDIREIN